MKLPLRHLVIAVLLSGAGTLAACLDGSAAESELLSVQETQAVEAAKAFLTANRIPYTGDGWTIDVVSYGYLWTVMFAAPTTTEKVVTIGINSVTVWVYKDTMGVEGYFVSQ